MRVLIVEDEPKIAAFIQKGLREENYVVDVVADGEEAFVQVSVTEYDIIILDVMLPKSDGITVCRELRESGISTPILMLTARTSIDDRVRGLDNGADDYMAKPFAFRELLARLRALTRRPATLEGAVLQVADLTLDTINHEVKRGSQIIQLAPKEYNILEYLMRHRNQVLSRTLIGGHIWTYDFNNTSNVLDVYIRNLRRKIDDNYPVKLLHTVRGVGYKLAEGISDDTK